ncbi:MAG: sugar phosphate isomerase/epimerase [Spirochaetales bacterium]
MRLAFSTLGCPNYTLQQAIEAAKQYGYEGISLRTIRGESYLPDLEEFSPRNIARTARLIRQAGLSVPCVMSGVRFTSPDPAEREKQRKDAEAYIDIAHALGSPSIRVFGGPIPQGQNEEETMGWIVDGIRGTCDLASRRGILVLLETHDSFSTGTRARKLLEAVSHPSLAIAWDFLHSCRFGESLESSWQQIGRWVKDVHVKDSSRYSADGFDLKLPGEGTLPIPEAMTILHRNGYDGWLTFEWEKAWNPEIEEPEVALPHFIAYMKRYNSELQMAH